jgi:translation elongation factor EF-1beta
VERGVVRSVEPLAFGLRVLRVRLLCEEEAEAEAEEALAALEGVGSVDRSGARD